MPKDKPDECKTLHFIECSCWQGNTYKATPQARKRWKRIEDEFSAVEEEVAKMPEWRGHSDFAVVYQPWTKHFSVRQLEDIRALYLTSPQSAVITKIKTLNWIQIYFLSLI